MIVKELKVALKCYFGTFILFFIVGIGNLYLGITHFTSNALVYGSCFFTEVVVLKIIHSNHDFGYALRAALLGFIFAAGVFVKLTAAEGLEKFGTYACVMAFFHFSEFVTITLIKPDLVRTESFMINHSPEYIAAALTSWFEFFVEWYLWPGMKCMNWLSNLGLLVCVLGELLRKIAMITAGSNFNHCLQWTKANDHELVTTGVYSWFRHPSYVGWFYWSIGTQIILLNPLCVPAYAIASWLFFNSRIYIEEVSLLNFFGDQYHEYQLRVGTGIPFIKGYELPPTK